MLKCDKFLEETCGCTLADGSPCSTLFPRDYFIDTRTQTFFLSRNELEMLLLGSVASTVCDDDDVGVRSGHKPAKWQRTTIDYMHKGYHICRNTYTLLHGVGKAKIHSMKNHFLDNGLAPWEHGNTGTTPSMPLHG